MGIRQLEVLSASFEHEDQLYLEKLIHLLSEDMDFHNQDSGYASHNFHSFPARFPPQLPRRFIQSLTTPGQAVLDPMMGSGTTVLEAFFLGRQNEIRLIAEEPIKAFFELAFSAIIITKSGGVSLAFDLAHTRPHRAKIVTDRAGQIIIGSGIAEEQSPRAKLWTKKLRSPFDEFEKRIDQNLKGLPERDADRIQPYLSGLFEPEIDRMTPSILLEDAQNLPLDNNSIDLIVTSPPYASNAIDYMRAHKFSLVWFGYTIDDLGERRKECIGGESIGDFLFEELPDHTSQIVASITNLDEKKGRVLHRYYCEMTRTLGEMFRVLKPGKAAIVVVGSSVMRGKDTETQACLAEIGQTIGFQVPKIGVRNLDRNRRMMPTGATVNLDSQIQKRMHEEYIIGFYRPLF